MQSSGAPLFRALTHKIHPQLPLNPRESQQLLNLLTTSFRRHLDQEHPRVQSGDARDARLLTLDRGQAATKGGEGPPAHTSRHLANHHLESLLTNPLFARRPARRSTSPTTVGTSKTHIPEMHRLMIDPLDWFEDRVAEGTADLNAAELCLETLRKNTSPPLVAARVEGKAAGSKILSWLRSSGHQASKDFIVNYKLAKLLSWWLVLEGRQEVVWQWLDRDPNAITQALGVHVEAVYRWKARVLLAVVQANLAQEGPKDAAVMNILRAAYRETDALPPGALSLAARYLIQYLTFHPPLEVADNEYDNLISIAHKWSASTDLALAVLWLQHPHKSNPQPGLDYLNDQARSPQRLRDASGQNRRLHVQLCLGVARQLLAQERYSDGAWVLEFARDVFSRELGLTPEVITPKSKERTVQEDELMNMRLLDGLSLG